MSTISKQMNEQEKINELMKVRYEVIALWPNCVYHVGKILDRDADNLSPFYDSFPHLFKKLQWWDRREEGEMKAIEYIRWNEHQIKFNGEDKNEVMKVESVRICNPGGSMAGMFEFVVERTIPGKENNKYNYPQLFIPATLSDYNQFINLSKEK